MKTKITAAVAAAALLAACTSDPFTGQQKVSNTAGGAAIGAGLGALAGIALGGGSDRRNALIGAGVGALAGGAVGNYMDRQEADLRAQLQGTGVSVTRNGDQIILNMPSNITFATDQDQVMPSFYPTLNSVALVLQRFPQTIVDVYGHTDSTGSAEHNQALSERRAMSVANHLYNQGINGRRFLVEGFGKTRPIASNATAEGRAANRRVEIQLSPLS